MKSFEFQPTLYYIQYISFAFVPAHVSNLSLTLANVIFNTKLRAHTPMTCEYVKIYMFLAVFWYTFIYSASLFLLMLLFNTKTHTHTHRTTRKRVRESDSVIKMTSNVYCKFSKYTFIPFEECIFSVVKCDTN